MFDVLSSVKADGERTPPSFEDLNVAYGYVLYAGSVSCLQNSSNLLKITKFHDRSYVILDKASHFKIISRIFVIFFYISNY